MLRTLFLSAASAGRATSSAHCALAGILAVSGSRSICTCRLGWSLGVLEQWMHVERFVAAAVMGESARGSITLRYVWLSQEQ
jgi:hypothetical protein